MYSHINIIDSCGKGKIMISRNVKKNKNDLSKEINNNTYKKIILSHQICSNIISPINLNIKHNNTTNSIIKYKEKKNESNFMSNKKNNEQNKESNLFRYILSKKKISSGNTNNKHNFSFDILKNVENLKKLNNKKEKFSKFYGFLKNKKGKISNIPISSSPLSKGKITNNYNKIGLSPSPLKVKENKDFSVQKRLSTKKEINNLKIFENSINHNNIKIIMNFFNKKGKHDKNNLSLTKTNMEKDNPNDNNINHEIKNVEGINETNKKSKQFNNKVCNTANLGKGKKNIIRNITTKINYSKEGKKIFAEEAHFKSVLYMQKLKKLNETFE